MVKRLDEIGARIHRSAIAVARTHLIRAAASAWTRVQLMDAADPVGPLMADLGSPTEAALKLASGHDTPIVVSLEQPPVDC